MNLCFVIILQKINRHNRNPSRNFVEARCGDHILFSARLWDRVTPLVTLAAAPRIVARRPWNRIAFAEIDLALLSKTVAILPELILWVVLPRPDCGGFRVCSSWSCSKCSNPIVSRLNLSNEFFPLL